MARAVPDRSSGSWTISSRKPIHAEYVAHTSVHVTFFPVIDKNILSVRSVRKRVIMRTATGGQRFGRGKRGGYCSGGENVFGGRFHWRLAVLFVLFLGRIGLMAGDCARVDIVADHANLSPGEADGFSFRNYDWGEEEVRPRALFAICYRKVQTPDGWQEMAFSFESDRDDSVSIHVLGSYSDRNCWTYYDEVKLNDEYVADGGFENGGEGWSLHANAEIVREPAVVKFGQACVILSHDAPASVRTTVKKGQNTITLYYRYSEPREIVEGDIPLDLKGFMNAGFVDDVAGDGKGGWSDQGAENCFSDFEYNRKQFLGMSFNIVDPAANNGKGVVTFDSEYFPTGTKSVTLPLPAARRLYLLHAACYVNDPAGTELARLVYTLADGKQTTLPLCRNIDIGDWWGPVLMNNLHRTCVRNGKHRIGLYVSCFDIPEGAREATLETTGKCVWVVLAATATNRTIELKEIGNWKPGDDYKELDVPSTVIIPNSAFDRGRLLEPGPAGKFGRAVIGTTGNLEFEQQPGKPVRLMGQNWFSFRDLTQGRTPEEAKQRIEQFADLMRATGYNALRPLTFDGYLMTGATADKVFNPEMLDYADYLIAKLKERGIYTYLTIGGYRIGFAESPWGQNPKPFSDWKLGIAIGNTTFREYWQATAENMLDHVNPYTGLKWKDDPAILLVEYFNEQSLGIRKSTSYSPEILAELKQKYTAFLRKKYGEVDEAQVEIFAGSDDWAEFIYACLDEMQTWYEGVVRGIGYPGLLCQWNCARELLYAEFRYRYADITSVDSYYVHPRGGTAFKKGQEVYQTSAIADAGSWWRAHAVRKFSDRPALINEYNHCFWNRYEYEQMLPGIYSALQNFCGLFVHENQATLELAKVASPFWSYVIDQPTEFLLSSLFLRGDVTKAKHLVRVDVPDAFFRKGQNLFSTANMDQSLIALMTGFGLHFPDTARHATLTSAVPQPDMVLPPVAGSAVWGQGWFTETKDDGTSQFDIAKAVQQMKAQGILPDGNLSDPANGIYQSDTGEIVMNTEEKILTVITPPTVAVASPWEKAENLGPLTSIKPSVPSLVALTAIDGKPLGESRRMVLIYATAAANTDMELNADRITCINPGKLPVLMKTGRFHAEFHGDPKLRYTLYPLAFNGLRRDPIKLKNTNGIVEIDFRTDAFEHGPTPFFELIVE